MRDNKLKTVSRQGNVAACVIHGNTMRKYIKSVLLLLLCSVCIKHSVNKKKEEKKRLIVTAVEVLFFNDSVS